MVGVISEIKNGNIYYWLVKLKLYLCRRGLMIEEGVI